MASRWGSNGNSDRLYFGGLQNHWRWSLQPWNEKTLAPWKKSYDWPWSHIKKQRHYLTNKGPSSQGYGFSSSHVLVLDQKETWALKHWCFWTVMLEKTLRVPWTARRSNQSILKEISPEYSLEGLMLKQKLQYFGHLIQRTDSLETLMLGKIEGRRRRGGTTEDEMVAWHHWLDGHEFEQAPGVGDGQRSLECCSPWGCKESDRTEWLKWTELRLKCYRQAFWQ